MNKKTKADEEEEDDDIAKFIKYARKHAVTEKVLITGGCDDDDYIPNDSTLIFDVITNSFQKGPEMNIERYAHKSTRLSDGRVFICGGCRHGGHTLSSRELFDAKTNAFTKIGYMNESEKRRDHAVVTLPDDRVFIVGGFNHESEHLKCAEIYDPASNKFTTCKGRLAIARQYHTANLISNGRILICGGENRWGFDLRTTEIYDIKTDSFSAGPELTTIRCYHASTTLLDGRILITGGELDDIDSNSTEFYDPKTNSFVAGPLMLNRRRCHSSSLLEDGRVLIIGGVIPLTTEIYDPKTNSFTRGPNLPSALYYHASSPFLAPFTGDIFSATKLKISK